MSERRRVTELAGGNPSIRLTPLPTGTGITLQPFFPADPQRSSDKRRCGHSGQKDVRAPPGVYLRDGCKRLQTLESSGKDRLRSAQAPWYAGLRELSCGRARLGEKAARRRRRREARRCDEASREFPALVRSA